jgi:hypothetical protein
MISTRSTSKLSSGLFVKSKRCHDVAFSVLDPLFPLNFMVLIRMLLAVCTRKSAYNDGVFPVPDCNPVWPCISILKLLSPIFDRFNQND